MDIWDQPVLAEGAGDDIEDEAETHTPVLKKPRQIPQVSNDSSDEEPGCGAGEGEVSENLRQSCLAIPKQTRRWRRRTDQGDEITL